MERRALVSLHRWADFDAVRSVLAACLDDLGGMARFVRPGQTVVVKPNLTANGPEASGGVTHVELAAAIVKEVLRCQPGRVIVAEGTAAFGAAHETAFPSGGWREMAARLGVELYNLDHGPHDEMLLDGARYPEPLPFSRLVRECDVFISAPCLKTHITADYTVALKNSFCLTPQRTRSEIHRQYAIEASLVDLNRIRKPDLVIVDGWDGAEGIAGGTDFERPAGARLMMAGDDPVAVDVIACELMALHQRTRYLQWAIADGVGLGDRAQIDLRGDPLADLKRRFMTPAEELTLLLPGLDIHDLGACSGCRIAALAAIQRVRHQKLLKPLRLVYGGEAAPAPFDADVDAVIIGDCARRAAGAQRAAGGLGCDVPGCPASTPEIMAAIEATGCICRQCVDLARAALDEYPPETLAWLRVTAAGAEVVQGERVDRNGWHVELVVGDCARRYVRVLRERAAQFGMDPEADVIWVRACSPHETAVSEGLRRAVERAASARGVAPLDRIAFPW